MPEYSEVKIMSEFINHSVNGKKFIKLYHVEKGNNPIDPQLINDLQIESISHGKQLSLKLYNNQTSINISVFMGMTGNWKWVKTEDWNKTKFIRMRLDSEDANSLILFGAYMGPKYKLNGFGGVKRGPDPLKETDEFITNIKSNLSNRHFSKSIPEVLLDQRYFNGIGAYLTAEILGRVDINPFAQFNSLNTEEINQILLETKNCCEQSYEYGGGELLDWDNPYGNSNIDEWINLS